MNPIPMSALVHHTLLEEVRYALMSRNWRYSTTGILQASTTERVQGANLRIHLWHPSLRAIGVEEAGLIHSHAFEMTSYVVHGAMINTLYGLYSGGEYCLREFPTHNPIKNNCEVTAYNSDTIQAGELYYQPPGVLHDARPADGLAITVMHWRGPLQRAASVVRYECQAPIPASEETQAAVLEEARRAICG